MDIARKSCRLCLSETDFNVSLFGNYCRRTNMIDKILVCLQLHIEDNEILNTICHRCANNVEKYYEFISNVKKTQVKLGNGQRYDEPRHGNGKAKENDGKNIHMNKRLVTSFVREEVYDADLTNLTFSFLEPSAEKKKESKPSSPLFSYFSTPNVPLKQESNIWKNQEKRRESQKHDSQNRRPEGLRRNPRVERPTPRHHSRDLFDSQSQDIPEDPDLKGFNWKLTPDDNFIKRVREKCFGLSDF